MSTERTKLIGILAICLTLIGAFGMVMLYRSALSPCLVSSLQGLEGFDDGFPIGKTVGGEELKLDLFSIASKGPVFLFFGLIWLTGAILVRTLMGWGRLQVYEYRFKLMSIFGAVFQMLGSFMFLYSAWGIVMMFDTIKISGGTSPGDLSLTYGMTLSSTLSGLATFTIGNVMTAIFLKHATSSEDAAPSSRKRKITASLSFVPMAIAAVALINAMIRESNLETTNGQILAGFIVGFALPMVVGSIPLLINAKSIPVK